MFISPFESTLNKKLKFLNQIYNRQIQILINLIKQLKMKYIIPPIERIPNKNNMSSNQNQNQNQEICSICHDNLDSTKNFAKTNCGHSFCLSCLVEALKHNNRCPLCRSNIKDKEKKTYKKINLQECVPCIEEAIECFPLSDHIDAIKSFDHPVDHLELTLKLFSIGLTRSIIELQGGEHSDSEEEEDD